MWARLQGVGISVRADTALPWPLLLLHKASQPALSPGPESVSAATSQIQTKKGGKKEKKTSQTNPVPPVLSLCHQPFFSTSGSLFFCLIANYRCACGKMITSHDHTALNTPASLPAHVCHSLCHLPLIIMSVFYLVRTVDAPSHQYTSPCEISAAAAANLNRRVTLGGVLSSCCLLIHSRRSSLPSSDLTSCKGFSVTTQKRGNLVFILEQFGAIYGIYWCVFFPFLTVT